MTKAQALEVVKAWLARSERVIIFDGEHLIPAYETHDGAQRMYYRKGEGCGPLHFATWHALAEWCICNPGRDR
jgi:hypothetical protein